MIFGDVSFWTENDEDETGWNGHLGEIAQENGFAEAHKCRELIVEKVDFANENIRGFSTERNFPHEILIYLYINIIRMVN